MGEKSVVAISKVNYDAGMALKQDITDDTLATTAKTISGAINELKELIDKLTSASGEQEIVDGSNPFLVLASQVNSLDDPTTLIGTEIEDYWTLDDDTIYYNPMIVVDIQDVEDASGNTHTAALLQRKYSNYTNIQFDAAENAALVSGTDESTADAELYYYGYKNYTYSLLSIGKNGTGGETIPYSDYSAIYHNAIKDTSCSIVKQGYLRWGESAIRKYLNSDADAWWTASHIGDVAPSSSNLKGYMAGCSAHLLAAIKPVKITSNLITSIDGSGTEDTIDSFWLPSVTEVYGSLSPAEGTYFPYWKTATALTSPSNSSNTGRVIKNEIVKDSGDAQSGQYVWLRSANTSSGYGYYIIGSGSIYTAIPDGAYRIEPVCAVYA